MCLCGAGIFIRVPSIAPITPGKELVVENPFIRYF